MQINRQLSDLHPLFRPKVEAILRELSTGFRSGKTLTRFDLFEGYRSPERQREVLRAGTSKASTWQSAHQFGLACDIVPRVGDGWSWEPTHDWTYLRLVALRHGADCPIGWDRAHVQDTEWPAIIASLRKLAIAR